MDILNLTLTAFISTLAAIVGYWFATRRAYQSDESDDSDVMRGELSALEGRIEALERRFRTLQSYFNATTSKSRKSNALERDLTEEERAFIDGLHPDERAKLTQDYISSEDEE